MNEQDMRLMEALLERQKELLEALINISEAQYMLAEALCPISMITAISDEIPPTQH